MLSNNSSNFQKSLFSLPCLSLLVPQILNPAITDDIYSVLSVEASVGSRTSFGGTAPENVRAAAAGWLERLATDEAKA